MSIIFYEFFYFENDKEKDDVHKCSEHRIVPPTIQKKSNTKQLGYPPYGGCPNGRLFCLRGTSGCCRPLPFRIKRSGGVHGLPRLAAIWGRGPQPLFHLSVALC